jgi:hypothetical protein
MSDTNPAPVPSIVGPDGELYGDAITTPNPLPEGTTVALAGDVTSGSTTEPADAPDAPADAPAPASAKTTLKKS